MQIISIINKKGGCGKTTSAIQLAAGLSLLNYKVLAIDMDEQGNLTSTSHGEKGAVGIFDVLIGKENINNTIQECIVNYDFIAADSRLSELDVILTKTGREYKLKKAISKLDRNYDFVIIDNPPSLGIAVTNSLTASNGVIITVQADSYNIEGLMAVSDFISDIVEYCNPELKIFGILLTRYNPRIKLNQYILDQFIKIAEAINTKVFKTFIRQSNSINQAQAHKMNIFDFDKKSNGALDYKAFIDEFLHLKTNDV